MDPQPPEQEQIAKAIQGDRGAMAQLLLTHEAALARYIAHRLPARLRSTVAEEDLVNKTFMQAFRDIRKFQPSPKGSFGAWLKAIADHRLIDAIKAARCRKRGGTVARFAGRPSSIPLRHSIWTSGCRPVRTRQVVPWRGTRPFVRCRWP